MVDCRDDVLAVVRRLAEAGEHFAALRRHELRRDHVAAAQGQHLAVHDGLHPLARRDLARQGEIHTRIGRPLHPAQHVADRRRLHDVETGRLHEIGAERLRHHGTQARVRRRTFEICNEQSLTRPEHAGAHERGRRADP